jgi:SAM-dependent methyltransferase
MSVSHNFREVSEEEVRNNVYANAWLDPSIPEQQLTLVTRELDQWLIEGKPMVLFDTLKDCMRHILSNSAELQNVIEIGCGAGHNSVVIDHAGLFNYLGIDYNPKFIELATKNFGFNKPNIAFKEMDALHLNIENGSFDIVLHSACLLHIYNWRAALDEAAWKTRRWLVLHRTPISMKHRTQYFLKDAYGVECLEIWFSENDLFAAGGLKGFILRNVWITSSDLNCRYATYLFERV